jgi:porin
VHIYQQNMRGGKSTHRRAGRYEGSYDLEVDADAEKLFGLEGGAFHMLVEGKWSKSEGIDGPSVGSVFGVNGDAMPRRTMDVTEFWYEQKLAGGDVRMRLGKMDITAGFEHHHCPVSFDCSSYAGDENTQFLNGALVNNPTIPFPDYGLGVSLLYSPGNFWYVSGAAVDAQADQRETGFNTTFHDEDYFLYIFETGLTPLLGSENGGLPGAYRAGLWYDPQPKANTELEGERKSYRDDVGFYLTCDQMVVKENANAEDMQGLGVFFRYGYGHSERNDIVNFVSGGLQYQGLIEGRDSDVLGIGFAHGTFSNSASSVYTEDYEAAFEVYYSAEIAPWFIVSPDFQYIVNPGGQSGRPDAVVIGARTLIIF